MLLGKTCFGFRRKEELIHPINEYTLRQHMIARLKVEAVFS
jgi:hypothetical protein